MKRSLGGKGLSPKKNLFFCEKAEMCLVDEKTLKLYIRRLFPPKNICWGDKKI